uniref:RIMS-binding protein 2 n=1 Tax=Lygus hesperus TaxID=30085 RepID=A0A0A9WBA4_LYGHE
MRRSTRRQKGPAYDLADSEDERPTMGKGFSFSTLPFPNFDSSQNKLDWNAWRRKFERYRLTSRLIHEQDEVQVSVLLLSMGDDAEDIYESFSLKSPSFNQVVDKFNKFYEKKTNIVYERAKFNRRSQLENESAESFVVNLYKLIKTCSYGPLHDELLRDRLVVGVTIMESIASLLLAKTVRADRGKRWSHSDRNTSSGIRPLARSFMRRQRWDGFWSPSSRSPNNWRSFDSSESENADINFVFKVL